MFPVSHVVVLGAGELGSAAARALAAAGGVRRVTLVDDAVDVARGKALDIRQAGAVEPADAEVGATGDLAAVVGAAAVVLGDRHGRGEWAGDEGLMLLGRVRALNPRALVVCAGPAQLTLVERAVAEHGADRRRLVGSAPEAARAGAIALLCLEAGCAPRDVSLALLGRPPADAFVPWADASIAGRRVEDVVSPPALSRLDARLARLWPAGPTALAAAACRVVRLALSGGPGTACLFAVPDHESGLAGPGAALPVPFAPAGLRVAMPTLTARDRVRLDRVLAR